jgi:hypothetical protein
MFDFRGLFKSKQSTRAVGAATHARDAKVDSASDSKDGGSMKILKKGHAMRVIFFYPGEEGTYIDNADVVLYENGIIHIKSNQEETTTHLQNCEILWRFEVEGEDRANKVRLLKPKGGNREDERGPRSPEQNPDA